MQRSISCCLALLLPLNELQGEVRGLSGKFFLGQQLQNGKFELPSMSGALKDSGTINFSLEEDQDKKVEHRVDSETTSNERMGTTQNATTLNCVTIHDRMQACLPLMTKLDFHLFRISLFIYLFNVGINEYWSVKICVECEQSLIFSFESK